MSRRSPSRSNIEIGSSGLSLDFISCMSVLPMEVTRMVTCLRRLPVHGAFPGTGESFSLLKNFCAFRLAKSNGGERHQNSYGQRCTKGFHVSFSSGFFTFRVRVFPRVLSRERPLFIA